MADSQQVTLCRTDHCQRLVYRRRLCRHHYFYEKQHRARNGEIVSRKVDPARASAHLAKLVRLGHSLRSLAYLSGDLSHAVVRRALNQEGVISSSTELALLRIPIQQDKPWQDLDDRHLFLAVGTKRRLQALLAVGWRQSELSRRCGVPQSAITSIVRGQRDRVLVHIVRAVADLYDEIENLPSPTAPTKTVLAYRWPVPGEWDHGVIDDPDCSHDAESRRKAKQKKPTPHIAETSWSTARRMHSHLAYGTGRPRVAAQERAKVCAHLLRKGHDVAVVATAFRKSREWVYAKAREGGWTPSKLQEVS